MHHCAFVARGIERHIKLLGESGGDKASNEGARDEIFLHGDTPWTSVSRMRTPRRQHVPKVRLVNGLSSHHRAAKGA